MLHFNVMPHSVSDRGEQGKHETLKALRTWMVWVTVGKICVPYYKTGTSLWTNYNDLTTTSP